MIKNLVFDFGQVMVHFEPSYMVSRFVTDTEDAKLLEAVIFDRLYWDKLDAGTISDEEVVSSCLERLPASLHPYVPEIYYNWIYNIPEIDGMRELVRYFKTEYGVGVYLLSNICTYFADHAEEISVLKEFDKCIFSAVCQKVKPNAEIFAHLCKECNILPEETVFIDDNPKNIDGSEAFGIRGYLFDGNAEKLKAYLESVMKEGKNEKN